MMLPSFLLPLALCASTTFAVVPHQWKDLYEAARKEGKTPLRVFTGGDQGGHGLVAAWHKQFPEVPIEVTIDLSKYLDGRINRGYDENKPVADAIVAQTVQDFPRWKQLGHLVPYKFPNFTKLTDAGKDPEGYYWPVSWNGFGAIAFDKTKCPENTIPKSYADFAEPQWKGKLVLTYPNDDDAINWLFAKTTKAAGYKWLDGLANNDVHWVRGTHTPTDIITKAHGQKNNKRCLTFTGSPGPEPWWSYADPDNPYESEMFWLQTAALLKGSQRPASQKLFANWITAGATDIFKENYEKTKGPQWFEYLSKNFSDYMHDRAQVERWRFYFEDKFGTAQGPSPLKLYPDKPDPPKN